MLVWYLLGVFLGVGAVLIAVCCAAWVALAPNDSERGDE